jgi:hypothetical protein
MKKLLFLCMVLSLTVQAFGHGGVSKEILKQLFPEAENFVNRQKALTAQQVSEVERDSGDLVQEVDKNLNVFVAVAKDPATGKMRSIGAVLMVDARGSAGAIDLVVAYNLDGSVKKVLVAENQDDKALESNSFLGQFEGKGPSDSWDPAKDFKLAGNPSSARALISAVHRGMHLFLAFIS